MRTALSLLLALCVLPACGPDAPPPEPTAGMALPPDYDYPDNDTVRVATWNLEHFVDGYDNPYIDAEREDRPEAAIEGRVRLATRALQRLDADLVVLQEAEGEAFLQTLAEEHLDDLGYRFATSVESPSWYMNVVLLGQRLQKRLALRLLQHHEVRVEALKGPRRSSHASLHRRLRLIFPIGVNVRVVVPVHEVLQVPGCDPHGVVIGVVVVRRQGHAGSRLGRWDVRAAGREHADGEEKAQHCSHGGMRWGQEYA